MRICASLSNFKSYCTSPDIGARPHAGNISANPQSPNEMIRLLTSKPQKKHINRSNSIMVAKYPKLCSNFKRIFSSKRAPWTLRAGCAAKSDCWFFGRLTTFCDSCTCELNNTATPQPHGCIKATFQIVESRQSPIYSSLPLLFSVKVAVGEGEVDRHRHVLKVDFTSFRNARPR